MPGKENSWAYSPRDRAIINGAGEVLATCHPDVADRIVAALNAGDRLPRTADGMPISPGMTVYAHHAPVQVHRIDALGIVQTFRDGWLRATECYSTWDTMTAALDRDAAAGRITAES